MAFFQYYFAIIVANKAFVKQDGRKIIPHCICSFVIVSSVCYNKHIKGKEGNIMKQRWTSVFCMFALLIVLLPVSRALTWGQSENNHPGEKSAERELLS